MDTTKHFIPHGIHKENNSCPFEYYQNGYNFKCERCDFDSEIVVEGDFGDDLNLTRYSNALACMIFHHSYFIRPHLNGFSGYGGLTFKFVQED